MSEGIEATSQQDIRAIAPIVKEQKEKELEHPVPPGFDDLAVEKTGLHILELGQGWDSDNKANESRLVLRRMPQQLHEGIDIAMKSLLPVDSEYKKELFEIASGDRLPPAIINAVNSFVEKHPDEYQEFIRESEVLKGLPETYIKAYFSLPQWEAFGDFFEADIRTVRTGFKTQVMLV